MHQYLADLHIHSRFSRATSKKLNIPLLAAWARLKGISVLGTGDFTHPKWRAELAESLRYDEKSGLYELKDPASINAVLPELPVEALGGKGLRLGTERNMEDATGRPLPPVRFMLQGEISSIYKRGDKTRKVHNLVFMPDLETAEQFSLRLAEIGNLNADGRPILGLDSRDLLEMVLESHPQAFLIPAHIWTPWFALFGSKSGFDRIEDCFGDLSHEIFALETGLSSDPAMNRLWSALDDFRLVSNSDAHSGENLGREANVFEGDISYSGILNALKNPEKENSTAFLGTLEFFPEEGKYHMDGHRKCNVLLSPAETAKLNGICPVCGEPVTVGVLNRVMELADRDEPAYQNDAERGEGGNALGEGSFASLVPLPEVLGEIFGVGPKSVKVREMYARVLERFGPELDVLRKVPETELADFFPPLGEAVGRMRRGQVDRKGGFDGEYGAVRMFTDAERMEIALGASVFGAKRGKRSGVRGLSLPMTAPAEAGTDRTANADENATTDSDANTKASNDAGVESNSTLDVSTGAEAESNSCSDADTEANTDPDTVRKPDATTEANASDSNVLADTAGPMQDKHEHEPDDALPSSDVLPDEDEDFIFSEVEPSHEESSDAEATRLPGLNADQSRAVMAGPDPVLVLAGPGTGKTRTLIARAAYLTATGVDPQKIVAVTFTRRAAAEMRSRLAITLGEDSVIPRSDTLHALAYELWQATHTEAPILLSEESARRVFDEANASENAQNRRNAWKALNIARETLTVLPYEFARFEQPYSDLKKSANLADYTDLLEFWLGRINSGIYLSEWEHVLVDEVQDLSPLQLSIIRDMLPPSGYGFFGIGDPDQSIYSFRGAHGQCLEFFSQAWPELVSIRLSRNYRSLSDIIVLSHAALGGQAGPALLPTREGDARTFLFQAPSAEAEAIWVAEQISALIGTGSHTLADATGNKTGKKRLEADHSPGDIAVLVRTHAIGSLYRTALGRAGIPASHPGTEIFWSDERVSLLLESIGATFGITATPPPPGKRSMPPCPPTVLSKGPVAIAAYLTEVPPFDTRFWSSTPFKALIKVWDEHKDWASLLTWIHTRNELELVRAKAETVQVMSVHAAKGLEFRSVFMPGLEDGLVPFLGPGFFTGSMAEQRDDEQMQEEQRLFYVGLTRAKDYLFLSCAKKRMIYGKDWQLKPSRYLDLLPKELLLSSSLTIENKPRPQQLSLI